MKHNILFYLIAWRAMIIPAVIASIGVIWITWPLVLDIASTLWVMLVAAFAGVLVFFGMAMVLMASHGMFDD